MNLWLDMGLRTGVCVRRACLLVGGLAQPPAWPLSQTQTQAQTPRFWAV
jgi:hypothetical protein